MSIQKVIFKKKKKEKIKRERRRAREKERFTVRNIFQVNIANAKICDRVCSEVVVSFLHVVFTGILFTDMMQFHPRNNNAGRGVDQLSKPKIRSKSHQVSDINQTKKNKRKKKKKKKSEGVKLRIRPPNIAAIVKNAIKDLDAM